MFYFLARDTCALFLRIFCRMEIIGREHIPPDGAVILVANHESYWDPIAVGSACRRLVRFMAKAELFKIPIFGLAMKGVNAFPVKRNETDRQALRVALQVLNQGGALGLFPEGTTRGKEEGQLLPFREGVALFATKTGSPVIPIAVTGTWKILSRRGFSKVKLLVGHPLRFDEYVGKKNSAADLEKVTMEIKKAVEKLLQEISLKR